MSRCGACWVRPPRVRSSGFDGVVADFRFMPLLNRNDSALLERLAAVAQSEPGLLVGGVPERWRLRSTWRCGNDHVGTEFTSGVIRRRPRCVFCGRLLFPTFPEDRSGPLPTRPEEYRLIVTANMTRPPRPVTHRRARRSTVQPSDYQSSGHEIRGAG